MAATTAVGALHKRSRGAPTPAPNSFLGWVGELVHAHRVKLIRVARRAGLSPEEALDSVQDAFAGFLLMPQARIVVQSPDDALKLLTVVVRNVARNRRRLHRVARPHTSDPDDLDVSMSEPAPSVEELMMSAEDHVRLFGCFNRLSKIQRAVVQLRMLDEVPGVNVATMLGMSPENVATRLHRAKIALRDCMREVELG